MTQNSFEEWWKDYPRKVKKKAAKKCYDHLVLEEGVDPENLNQALEVYIKEIKDEKKEKSCILHASTFLGPQGRWEEYLESYEEAMYKGKTEDKLCVMLDTYWPKRDDPDKVRKEVHKLLDICFSIDEAKEMAYKIRDKMNRYLQAMSKEDRETQYIKSCSNWLREF